MYSGTLEPNRGSFEPSRGSRVGRLLPGTRRRGGSGGSRVRRGLGYRCLCARSEGFSVEGDREHAEQSKSTYSARGKSLSSIEERRRSNLRAKGPSSGSATEALVTSSARRVKGVGELTFEGSLFSKMAYMGISHNPGSLSCPLHASVWTRQSFARPLSRV